MGEWLLGADAGGGGGVSIGAERALSANRVTAGVPAQNRQGFC